MKQKNNPTESQAFALIFPFHSYNRPAARKSMFSLCSATRARVCDCARSGSASSITNCVAPGRTPRFASSSASRSRATSKAASSRPRGTQDRVDGPTLGPAVGGTDEGTPPARLGAKRERERKALRPGTSNMRSKRPLRGACAAGADASGGEASIERSHRFTRMKPSIDVRRMNQPVIRSNSMSDDKLCK